MLCYRCGGHVKDGSDKCVSCGQRFDPGLKAGSAAGFGAGIKRPRHAVQGAPCAAGDRIAGRYLIQEHAGSGPLGWMFRATEAGSDALVALKVLSPRFLQLPEERRVFVEELQKAQRLAHPNIARIYQAGDDEGRPFIAAQHLEGLTLRRIMDLRRQKGQRFTLQEVEPIVAQIAAALEAAGSAFAHGNLKPDNVIVLPDLLKLTDFGLAVSLPRAPFMAAQRAAGVHRYLAPEFLLGEPLDARTDVFSLGVMLAEMLGGVQYEAQLNLLEKNPALPDAVDALVRRAASPRPGARFASAAQMAAELSELVSHEPRLAPSPQAAGVEDAGDVVIVESVTDPRLRIARALGAVRAPEPAETPLPPYEPRFEPPIAPVPAPAWSSSPPTEGALAIGPTRPALEPIAPDVQRIETPPRAFRPVATPPPGVQRATPQVVERAESRPPAVQRFPTRPPGASFGALEEQKPSRAPLFAMGVVALVVLVGGGVSVLSSRDADSKPADEKSAEMPAADAAKNPAAKDAATKPPDAPPADAAKADAKALVKAETRRADPERSQPAKQFPAASRRDGNGAHHSMGDQVRAVKERVEKALAEHRRQQQEAAAAAEAKRAADQAQAAHAADEETFAPAVIRAPAPAPLVASASLAASSARELSCPSGMQKIPGGAVCIGSDASDDLRNFGDRPLTRVELKPYCIDQYEFPNQPGKLPKVAAPFAEAAALCKSAGKRLCSEEEWEAACRGPQNLRFPYGARFDPDACNTTDGKDNPRQTSGAGAFSRCKSGYNVFDLSGNAAEWTSGDYDSTGIAGKTVKGGSAARPGFDDRCASRRKLAPGAHAISVGFRCCADGQ